VAPIEVPPRPLEATAAHTPQLSPMPPLNFQLADDHKEWQSITKSNFLDAGNNVS
jgi:hypothetical protein